MLRHANEPAPPLRSVRRNVDPALAEWVDRLLAKAPAERPAAPRTGGRGPRRDHDHAARPRWRRQARVVSLDGARAVPARDGTTPVADREATPRPAAAPRRSRRRWLAAAVAGAAGVALAAAAAVTFVGGSDESTPPANPSPTCSRHPPSASARPAPDSRSSSRTPSAGWKLAAPALGVASTLRDPARPRAVARARGALLVADDQGLTVLDTGTLAPRAARASGRLAARRGQRRGGGRVDSGSLAGSGLHGRGRVAPRRLRIASLRAYRPRSGPGRPRVRRGRRRRHGHRLPHGRRTLNREGRAVRAGRRPHGPILFRRGLLYVGVRRGSRSSTRPMA